jgi:hemerythrin-like domain-containing protein
MKPTKDLMDEHEGILRMLDVLQAVCKKIPADEKGLVEDLEGIMDFFTIFVDRCHHGKEEEFLFPALENIGIPKEGGPIGLMLAEHQQGREFVMEMRKALKGFNPESSVFAETATHYIKLLRQHIDKENTVLFSLADRRLSADTQAQLMEDFDRLERDRIGVGRHEKFHRQIEILSRTYL